MAAPKPNIPFDTGASHLPDIGILFYNGCTFSPLFATEVSGRCVKDDALRTVKFMEYTITVDGYVTLRPGDNSIAPTMANLKLLLTQQGGQLIYQGRGNDIIVNTPGVTGAKDAAWGPIPELLEFQPLGGGLSAKVKWSVKVQVVEPSSVSTNINRRGGGGEREGTTGTGGNRGAEFNGGRIVPGPAAAFVRVLPGGGGGGGGAGGAAGAIPRLLQFNFESSVSYGEDGYASLSMRGVLEIPLTRIPNQPTRTFAQTADTFRGEVERRVMSGIDLLRFRVTRRNFTLSRDKRTLNWDIQCEELPYMNMPPNCTVARGTYSVRPARAGMGLCQWLCTLRGTYTVRHDRPRRIAWLSFLSLLRMRMAQSSNSHRIVAPANANPAGAPPPPNVITAAPTILRELYNHLTGGFERGARAGAAQAQRGQQAATTANPPTSWLMDFSFEEGLYLDSKTVSFSASWKIVTTISHILLASGIWVKNDSVGLTTWAISMRDVQGCQSWYSRKMDPDIIVDFGGG